MAALLVVLEGSLLFVSAIAVILFLEDRVFPDLTDLETAVFPALAIAAAAVVSFYYNDLYDLRIARRFGDFALRLLQAVGLTIVLLGFVYMVFPDMMVSRHTLITALAATMALTVALRAGWYAVLLRRPFSDRV